MRLANERSLQVGGTVAGRPVHTFEVLRSERLTPHIIRVVLGGSGFDTFVPNDFTDAYVKVVFVKRQCRRRCAAAAADTGQLQRSARRAAAARSHIHRAQRRHGAAGTRHRLRRARRSWRGRAVGACSHAGATGVSDGSQRRLRTRSRRRLAPARRRRSGPTRHQRGAGSVARQCDWQGVHRGRRTRRRDPAQVRRPVSA